MQQAGHITVSRLYTTPGYLIESTKINCFCATTEHAIDQFTKAILWNIAIMQRKE